MSFLVHQPGPLSHFQDLGRLGSLQQGLSRSGPMDEIAFRWGNALLGNPANSVQLEVALGGISLEAKAPVLIALCGAPFQAECNGKTLLNWCTHQLKAGDRLEIKGGPYGRFAYLAVKGGFKAPSFFGSCATTLRLGIGEKIKEKMSLLCAPSQGNAYQIRRAVPRKYIPLYQEKRIFNFFPSLQFSSFSSSTPEQDLSQSLSCVPFTLSNDCNRMGYRLEKGPLLSYSGKEYLSQPLQAGAIQIPPSGQPIILMKEAQTIGGYPLLGTLSTLDLSYLAQKTPQTNFFLLSSPLPTTLTEAQEKYANFLHTIQQTYF